MYVECPKQIKLGHVQKAYLTYLNQHVTEIYGIDETTIGILVMNEWNELFYIPYVDQNQLNQFPDDAIVLSVIQNGQVNGGLCFNMMIPIPQGSFLPCNDENNLCAFFEQKRDRIVENVQKIMENTPNIH